MRRDIYQKITDQIVAELEKGVRPWQRPWSASHMEGRVALPLRHNGVAYRGVNILSLWMAAMAKGYRAPIWMTFKQAIDLGGGVRKGEKGSLTVYADSITRKETDALSGEESETAIPFMKGYTVFNVEQIDGLPAHYYPAPEPALETVPRIARADAFFAATGAAIRHGGNQAYYAIGSDHVQMPPLRSLPRPRKLLRHAGARDARTGRGIPRASTAASSRNASAMTATRWKNWSPSLAQPSFARASPHAGNPRRSRQLSRSLAEGSESGQARDLYRRRACAARRRFPAWPPARARSRWRHENPPSQQGPRSVRTLRRTPPLRGKAFGLGAASRLFKTGTPPRLAPPPARPRAVAGPHRGPVRRPPDTEETHDHLHRSFPHRRRIRHQGNQGEDAGSMRSPKARKLADESPKTCI